MGKEGRLNFRPCRRGRRAKEESKGERSWREVCMRGHCLCSSIKGEFVSVCKGGGKDYVSVREGRSSRQGGRKKEGNEGGVLLCIGGRLCLCFKEVVKILCL